MRIVKIPCAAAFILLLAIAGCGGGGGGGNVKSPLTTPPPTQDTTTDEESKTVRTANLEPGMTANCSQPVKLRINKTTNKAYMHCRGTRSIGVLDIATGKIIKTIQIEQAQIDDVVIDEKRNRVFAIAYFYKNHSDGIIIIDGGNYNVSMMNTNDYYFGLAIDSSKNLLYGIGYTTQAYSLETLMKSGNAFNMDIISCTPGGSAIRPSDGRLFFSDCQESINIYNPSTGVKEKSYAINNGNYSIPIDDANGNVFVITQPGSGYGFSRVAIMNISTGTITKVADFGSDKRILDIKHNPVSKEVIVAANEYYNPDKTSEIYFLDDSTLSIKATLSVSYYSPAIAIDQIRNRAIISESSQNIITILDGASHSVASSIVAGFSYTSIAVNDVTHDVYALDSSTRKVSILTGGNASLKKKVDINYINSNNMYSKMVVDSSRGVLYLDGINEIDAIDINSGVALPPINTGYFYHAYDVDTVAGIVYFSNHSSYGYSTITGVSAQTGAIVSSFTIDDVILRMSIDSANHAMYYSYYECVSSGGGCSVTDTKNIKKIALPSGTSTGNMVFNNVPIGFIINPNKGLIYTLTGSDAIFVDSVPYLEIKDETAATGIKSVLLGDGIYGMSAHNAANMIYVTDIDENNLRVIDGSTGQIIKTIDVGNMPVASAVDQSNGTVYVLNLLDSSISIYANN